MIFAVADLADDVHAILQPRFDQHERITDPKQQICIVRLAVFQACDQPIGQSFATAGIGALLLDFQDPLMKSACAVRDDQAQQNEANGR